MRTLSCLLALGLLTTLTACDKPTPTKSDPPPQSGKVDALKNPTATPKKVAGTPKATDTAKKDASVLGLGKTPSDIEPGQDNVYGGRFTIIEKPMTLASAISKADSLKGPVKVSAKVEKVCQKKGCWFTMKSDGVKETIRVTMKDYKFFIPTNAMGLPAVLEGTLTKKQIPQKDAQHFADDEAEGTGKPAAKITGPQNVYSFTATAVQITRPGA